MGNLNLERRIAALETRAPKEPVEKKPSPEDAEEKLQSLNAEIDAQPPEMWRKILDTIPPLHPWNGPAWLTSYTAERHGWGPVGEEGWQFLWWTNAALVSLICTPAHFSVLPEHVQERLLARAHEEVHALMREFHYDGGTKQFNIHMRSVNLTYLLNEVAQ